MLKVWVGFELLVLNGLARTIGVLEVPLEQISALVDGGRVPPSVIVEHDVSSFRAARDPHIVERIQFAKSHGLVSLSFQNSHKPARVCKEIALKEKRSKRKTALGIQAGLFWEALSGQALESGVHQEDVLLRWQLDVGLAVSLHSSSTVSELEAYAAHVPRLVIAPKHAVQIMAIPSSSDV